MESYFNPYLGPFSFKEEDQVKFYGRKKEVEEIIELLRNAQLTMIFGESGTGKSSLINAKLIPELKKQYFHPIYLRVNFESDSPDPLTYTKQTIIKALKIGRAHV